jgi:hypothetical protein
MTRSVVRGERRVLGRRAMLGAGLGALGLAALEQRAVAQADGMAAPRFVFLYTPCGREPSWRTETPGTAFTLGPTLQMFEAFRNRMAIVDGVTIVNFDYAKYNAHLAGVCTLLGGRIPQQTVGEFAGGIPVSSQRTFDHLLADRIGQSSPVANIVLGGIDRNNDAGALQLSYTGPDQPELPIHEPEKAFAALFAGSRLTPPGPEDLALRQTWEKEVLGLSRDQTSAWKTHLGRQEQLQLEAYESNLNAAFQRVMDPATFAPTTPVCSKDLASLQAGLSGEDYQFQHDLQSRVLAAALACGRTRVATYVMGSHLGSMTVPGSIPIDPNRTGAFAGAHHVHDASVLTHYQAFDRYYGDRIRFLLAELDSYPEGSGTVLDNTILVWSSEIGWDPLEHDHERHPLFLFGNVPGQKLNMGRYHQLPFDMGANREERLANPQNRRVHEVLLTLAQAMGITDLQGFADPVYDHGPIAELLV